MPSPFPGMDPYIEHETIWEDFHQSLAVEIRDQLTPQLGPSYYAAVVPRLTYEEVTSVPRPRGIVPDVGVFQASALPLQSPMAIASAPLVMEAPSVEMEAHESGVEIRTASEGELVTAIEILSRANKNQGSVDWGAYQSKRRALRHSLVHLMEIDLLRAGTRTATELESLPPAAYFVFLNRNLNRWRYEIWPVRLPDPLPIVPVPLNAPDPDVPLDLNKAAHAIYDRAAYSMRIDYRKAVPEPALSPEDARWVDELLQAKRTPHDRH